MNDPFPEELLSAYLDGELPHEERARVEQWLAASADHRRLFDDLQTIRRELQALPHQSLDAGFSDRVLTAIRGRADDTHVDGPAVAAQSPPTSAADVAPTVPLEPVSLPPRRLGMPAWRWFAAGVAATLLAVIAGINAAPETMAQMGKLAQLRSAEQKISGANQAAEPSNSMPTAKTLADRSEQRKEAALDERTELQGGGGAAPSAPTRMAVEAPTAPRAPLDEKYADADSREEMPAPPLAAALAAPPPAADDGVVELPVTGQQADRALAYAMTIERESARRALSNVDTVQNLAARNASEYAAAKSLQEESEAVFQRDAPGLSLMKLMDATTQDVQVAALEVTGTEAEILSLLDSLGVEGARGLRPQAALGGGGSGGTVGLRSFRGGENPRGGAEAKSAAAAEAKGDSLSGRGNVGREPSSKSGGYAGMSPVREQFKRIRESQREALDASQPQLRVRLVIVPPQTDSAGPTIEVKPAE